MNDIVYECLCLLNMPKQVYISKIEIFQLLVKVLVAQVSHGQLIVEQCLLGKRVCTVKQM